MISQYINYTFKMQSLNDLLNGKRNDELSRQEILEVVLKIFTSTDLLIRARDHFYIIDALKSKKLDANILLTIAIPEIKTVLDISLITIILLNGGNSNLYYNTSDIGNVHLIVYAVSSLKSKANKYGISNTNIIIALLTALQIMGAQTGSNAYSLSDDIKNKNLDEGFIDSISLLMLSDTKIEVTKKPLISVQEWLVTNGLPRFDNLDYTLKTIPLNFKIILGIYCDRPDLVYIDNINPTIKSINHHFDMILMTHSKKVISQYPSDVDIKLIRGEYFYLKRCVEAYFLDGYLHFLDTGLNITYFAMNRLCLKLKYAAENADYPLVIAIDSMIKGSVLRGGNLDYDQMSLIRNSSDSIADEILQIYNRPIWRKFCESKSLDIPDNIKRLSFNLNVNADLDKKSLCGRFRILSEADAQSLKDAARLRQKVRVGSGVSNISEFISGQAPVVTCQNKTVLSKDPFAYNDATMTFYRDSDDNTWCFTSDMYENIIKKPFNVYKSKYDRLPDEFIGRVEMHLSILKRLGISPSNPETIDDAIDQLTTPDQISSQESEKIKSTIIDAARINSIDNMDDVLQKITPQKMNFILKSIDMEQDGLELMTDSHKITTFCRAAYMVIKSQPNQANVFFKAVGHTINL